MSVRGTSQARSKAKRLALSAVAAGLLLVADQAAPLLAVVTPAAAQSNDSFLDRMKNMFAPGSPSPSAPQRQGGPPDDELACPVVDIRNGASTITVHGPGETVSTNVKYQATIAQTARECAVLGSTMTVKVGMQGRLLLGPVGGPGQLDIPVRVALVHEGPEPKTLWTKLTRIPVQIAAGQTNVPFVHVEQDLTIPTPKTEDIDMFVVYVGFDPQGAKEPKPKPAARPKPQASRQQQPPQQLQPQASRPPQELQPPQQLQPRRESGAAPPAR